MLRQTDHVTLVRTTGIDIGKQLFLNLRRRLVRIHVILLKHVLQLRLEGTEDRVNQTIREDRQPAVHLRCRERVVVRRQVIRRVGIHTFGTDQVQQHEEILQGRNLRLTHGCLVNLFLQSFTHLRIGSITILIVQRDDRVIDRFLCLPIQCTDTLGTLEEHMLQIVSKSCVLGRFIYGTGTYYYISGNVRLVMVFP